LSEGGAPARGRLPIRGMSYAKEDSRNVMVNKLPSKNERKTMELLFSPILANFYYVGGGSVGLILLIVVIVLLVRG
jgi:hypothetical protein